MKDIILEFDILIEESIVPLQRGLLNQATYFSACEHR
jgi:hypothetical protein